MSPEYPVKLYSWSCINSWQLALAHLGTKRCGCASLKNTPVPLIEMSYFLADQQRELSKHDRYEASSFWNGLSKDFVKTCLTMIQERSEKIPYFAKDWLSDLIEALTEAAQ